MGGCLSTHGRAKNHHHARTIHTKQRKKSRLRRHDSFVIPVMRSSIGSIIQRRSKAYKILRDFASYKRRGVFQIEKFDVHHNATNIDSIPQLEYHDGDDSQCILVESPIASSSGSKASKNEMYFDTDDFFNNDSDDDEYLSVYDDFPMLSNTKDSKLFDPQNNLNPQRVLLPNVKSHVLKTDDWMAGTSRQVGSLHTPPPEDEEQSSTFGTKRNGHGIAALADNLCNDINNIIKDESPKKRYHSRIDEKMTSSKQKEERAMSGLLGRKNNFSANNLLSCDTMDLITPNCDDNIKSSCDKPISDYKSIFDGICLPRLRTIVSSSRSRPLSPRNMTRKNNVDIMRLSFKLRTSTSFQRNHDSMLSKYYIERPIGDSQVAHCPPNKPEDGCWCEVEPSIFKLRGKHYAKDKKKFAAPNFSAFVPVAVDLIMSSHKIDHIAQYLELPFQESTHHAHSLPSMFIVNIQLPLYPPTLFMNETNGEGLSLVLYFKLSEDLILSATPLYLKDTLKKFVDDETEKVKGFVGESLLPFRDRLKIVARLVNPEEVQLSVAEKKLLVTYNEKPVLSRPQHCFYKEANYLEVDLDVHRFGYIARKGFDALRDRLKNCVLDIGLIIQGTRPEELPEQILAAVRLCKLDFGNKRVSQVAHTCSSSGRSGA